MPAAAEDHITLLLFGRNEKKWAETPKLLVKRYVENSFHLPFLLEYWCFFLACCSLVRVEAAFLAAELELTKRGPEILKTGENVMTGPGAARMEAILRDLRAYAAGEFMFLALTNATQIS